MASFQFIPPSQPPVIPIYYPTKNPVYLLHCPCWKWVVIWKLSWEGWSLEILIQFLPKTDCRQTTGKWTDIYNAYNTICSCAWVPGAYAQLTNGNTTMMELDII